MRKILLPREEYTKRGERHERSALRLDSLSRTIGTARLVVVLCAVALVVGVVWAHLPAYTWALIGTFVLAFVVLVVWHSRVVERFDRASAAAFYARQGIARLDDAWHGKGNAGDAFRDISHAFSDDLDLFGKASLFELLDTTQTSHGQERLASFLRVLCVSRDAIVARQDAARELSRDFDLRERLFVEGAMLGKEKPDVRAFIGWAESKETTISGSSALFARVWPIVTILAIVVGHALRWPTAATWGPYLVAFVVAFLWRARLSRALDVISSRERSVSAFAGIFDTIETARFESSLLKRAQEAARATGEMRSLGTIAGFIDARQNEVFRLFLAPLVMLEANGVLALERWRARTGGKVRGWFDAMAEIEALASIGTLTFDRPDYAWPAIDDANVFIAEALGHPLIPMGRRVANDVALKGEGSVFIVTGSNMSGKSTLLRAMGINAVLALMGGPVCAKRLSIGAVAVHTSMRVSDSLADGTSRFYAELKKLRTVIDAARARRGVLFLLDEVLHGTNARERSIGARLIVRELSTHGALGAVSTHDLNIADLEKEIPGVRNVHFEEQVENDVMTFDYKLRDGVVSSSNALRLMRLVGIDIVE